MIKKIFLLLLFCLVFASSAFATTQYYYLRQTGAGSNSGDSGTWTVVPTTDGNAMSASNFNTSGNWSDTESATKLDADDVVYVKGSWGGGYNLTINKGITLDFYESGDYDPETMSHSIEPVFSSEIYIKSNDVNIYDGRFDWAARAIIVEERSKIQRIKVLRNYFNVSRAGMWVAIYFGFLCDSEVGYNSFEGIPYSECSSDLGVHPNMGRAFVLNAGSRNKIHHNTIKGGWTAFYFPGSRTWDYDLNTIDYPSSGSYTADPEANYEDNEISYNTIEWRCQEGITYDASSHENVVSIVERDTVATVSGTAVTLSHAGWSAVGNLYSGYYMTALSNRDNVFGNHSLIEAQSGNSFTLATPIANLGVGDTIVIGMAFRHNWIHHNTFTEGRGFAASSILLEGMALENLVEYNVLPRVNWTEGMGISIASLDGYTKAVNNVTGTYASEPTAYNVVRNNTSGGIWNHTFDKGYGPSADFITRNNSIYNNDVYTGDYYPRYVSLANANAYVDKSGSLKLGTTGSLRATDPTGYVSDYFSNWGSQYRKPLLILPTPSPEDNSSVDNLSPRPPQNIAVK